MQSPKPQCVTPLGRAASRSKNVPACQPRITVPAAARTRNTGYSTYTIQKTKKRRDCENAEPGETDQQENRGRVGTETSEMQGAESVLADMSIPFENCPTAKKIDFSSCARRVSALDSDERLGSRQIGEDVTYLPGGVGVVKKKRQQNGSKNSVSRLCGLDNTRSTTVSELSCSHNFHDTKKPPINLLTKEVMERKQRLNYQNEVINSLESEESFTTSSHPSFNCPQSFPADQTTNHIHIHTSALPSMETQTLAGKLQGLRGRAHERDYSGIRAPDEDRFQCTTKCNIKELLRPITSEERDIQKKVKERENSSGLPQAIAECDEDTASRPYMMFKVNTKLSKGNDYLPGLKGRAAGAQGKEVEEGRCVIF